MCESSLIEKNIFHPGILLQYVADHVLFCFFKDISWKNITFLFMYPVLFVRGTKGLSLTFPIDWVYKFLYSHVPPNWSPSLRLNRCKA